MATQPSDFGLANQEAAIVAGLLPIEMITGKMRVGADRFVETAPAMVCLIDGGAASDIPTYATLDPYLDTQPFGADEPIIYVLDAAGQVNVDDALQEFGVTAGRHSPETNHRVASVFWDALTQANGDDLAEDPFSVVGKPIFEAYWIYVDDGVNRRELLIQCFERQCLTYTPGNPRSRRVEEIPVGQHYEAWRYGAGAPAAQDAQPSTMEPTTTGDVQIIHILYDSPVKGEHSGEFVTIANADDHPVQLEGWRLTDGRSTHMFTFPQAVLRPAAALRVHNCRGEATDTDLYTGKCNPWWNNDGDTAYLYDTSGTLVSQVSY